MRAHPIVFKYLQLYQGIPGRIPLGKRVGFAGERIEPITQRPIEPFHMHGAGRRSHSAQRGADFDGQQMATTIAMFDGLGQLQVRRNNQSWTPALPRMKRVAIGVCQNRGITVPAITVPDECPMTGSLHRVLHGRFD